MIPSLNKAHGERKISVNREEKKWTRRGNVVENASKTRRIQRRSLGKTGNRLVVNGNEQSFSSRG